MAVGVLLAAAGGLIDAYTYVSRGGVFAFAQTANILLLAIRMVEGNFGVIAQYLVPIVCFSAGLFLCKILSRYVPVRDRERLIVLFAEVALLAVIGTVSMPDLAVTSCVSFISAMQFGSFRLLDGYPYATTMCTGNLRVTVESLYELIFDRNKASGLKCLKYLAVLTAFTAGAVASAFLSKALGEIAVTVAIAPVGVVILLLIWDELRNKKRKDNTASLAEVGAPQTDAVAQACAAEEKDQ